MGVGKAAVEWVRGSRISQGAQERALSCVTGAQLLHPFGCLLDSISQYIATIVGVFRKVLIILLAVGIFFAAFEIATWPDVAGLASHPPSTTAFMERRRAELRAAGKDDTISYHFVPYGRISPYLRRAVLVAEDDTFYEHDAIDVKGIEAALQRDLKNRKLTHGGSTITQQLAKNLYLSPSRNPFRKLKEYFLARSLERHLTKKRILELYLNVAELGERVYGAEAGARLYFHQSAASLSPSQAALLASILHERPARLITLRDELRDLGVNLRDAG